MDDDGRFGLLNRSDSFLGVRYVNSKIINSRSPLRITIRRLDVEGGDGAFRVLFEESIDDGRANETHPTSDQSAGN